MPKEYLDKSGMAYWWGKLKAYFVSDANYVHTDNNYTTAEKTKLSGIASGAEVNVQADWNITDNTSDAFIKNKPTIPANTSDLTNDSNFVSDSSYVHTDNNYTTTDKNKLAGIASGAEVNVQSDWSETDTSSDAYIAHKPSIPAKTSDLTNDSNFVSDASYVHTDNNYTSSEKTKLSGIASGAEVNVQADWNESDSSSDAFIKNKPTIPSAGVTDVKVDGTSVVTGGVAEIDLTGKQDILVSGTNIKTINNQSLLGSGNISIGGGGGGTTDYQDLSNKPQINSVELSGNKSFANLGLIDFFYPVGSYYETSDSTFNPNTAWGGTWSLEAEGLVHIGAGSTYTIGDTGGEATHILTTDEMPSHKHQVNYVNYNRSSGSNTTMGYLSSVTQSNHADTAPVGGDQAHNNMQPYVVVNRWHRTA